LAFEEVKAILERNLEKFLVKGSTTIIKQVTNSSTIDKTHAPFVFIRVMVRAVVSATSITIIIMVVSCQAQVHWIAFAKSFFEAFLTLLNNLQQVVL
jgi:hypothetical protein